MSLLVLLSVAATIVVNILANALPINGQTTAEISNRFDVLFTPAGYVFAIWGLIYVGLIVLAVYQALPGQRDHPRLRDARPWLTAAGPANIAWLLLWHYEYFNPTLVAMASLLATLAVAYVRLKVGEISTTALERWTVQIPVGVYLGWISVATIANAAVVLDRLGWNGWGIDASAWTAVMIGVALFLAGAIAWRRSDASVALVMAWAFAGIAQRNGAHPIVLVAAWTAALAALLFAVAAWRRRPSNVKSRRGA